MHVGELMVGGGDCSCEAMTGSLGLRISPSIILLNPPASLPLPAPPSTAGRASLPFPVIFVTASLARNIASKTSYNNNQVTV